MEEVRERDLGLVPGAHPPKKTPRVSGASFAPEARIAGRERAGTGSCFTTYPVHVDEVDNGDKLAIEGIRGGFTSATRPSSMLRWWRERMERR